MSDVAKLPPGYTGPKWMPARGVGQVELEPAAWVVFRGECEVGFSLNREDPQPAVDMAWRAWSAESGLTRAKYEAMERDHWAMEAARAAWSKATMGIHGENEVGFSLDREDPQAAVDMAWRSWSAESGLTRAKYEAMERDHRAMEALRERGGAVLLDERRSDDDYMFSRVWMRRRWQEAPIDEGDPAEAILAAIDGGEGE